MSSWQKLFNDQLQATRMQRERAELAEFKLQDVQLDFLVTTSVLREALAWLENAPFNYSNGNIHNGIDEGAVRGGELHDALVAKIKKVLGKV